MLFCYSRIESLNPNAAASLPPNQRVQPTPLRGPKIVPFLKSRFGSKLVSIYRGGAADARHVERSAARR